MDNSAKLFLSRDIQKSIKSLQKEYFDIVEDLKVSDLDNFESLREILKDDDLAKKFILFQENRAKLIRKKILDGIGTLTRDVAGFLDEYQIEHKDNVEIKGIVRN